MLRNKARERHSLRIGAYAIETYSQFTATNIKQNSLDYFLTLFQAKKEKGKVSLLVPNRFGEPRVLFRPARGEEPGSSAIKKKQLVV